MYRATDIAAVFILGLGLSAASGLLAQEARQLSSLQWLTGCWGADGGETGSGEFWVMTEAGELLGLARTVRDGRTQRYEFMQIESEAGQLVFTAQPSCESQTRFPLAELSEGAAVFENPDHDFPQRVSYRRVDEDRLLARVEGRENGVLRAVDFPMTRQACDVLGARPPAADQ